MPESVDANKYLNVFAPAKINLFLHVTNKRSDGYHLLDSLVVFADIGDFIMIEPALEFSLAIDGPFARSFSPHEKDSGLHSKNLVAKAAWMMARLHKRSLQLKITLTKNIPLGAGLGGGSSDAAAVIWGLMEYWGIKEKTEDMAHEVLKLGSDVPVCLECKSTRMRGTGELLDPLTYFNETPVVLIHTGKGCETSRVFSKISPPFREEIYLPKHFDTLDVLVDFLKGTGNDLHKAACEIVPEIDNAINALRLSNGCALARMSGSGSACFGIFESEDAAQKAQSTLSKNNPDWWVQSGYLGRPERY